MGDPGWAEFMLPSHDELKRCSTTSQYSVLVAALCYEPNDENECSSLLATAGSTEQDLMISSSSEDWVKTPTATARPIIPTLKHPFSFQLKLHQLKRRTRGSKDDFATTDSTQVLLSTTSLKSSTEGRPVNITACPPQQTLWHRLLPSCCLQPHCNDDEDSCPLLDRQQHLQKTSYSDSSADYAVECEVILRSQQPQLNPFKQYLEQQPESCQSCGCCDGRSTPSASAVEPAASAAGVLSTQHNTVCNAPAAAIPCVPAPDQYSSTSGVPNCASAATPESATVPSWSYGSNSVQNLRSHMEDRVLTTDLTGHPTFGFAQRAGLCAVFDGYGGDQTAEYLAGNLLAHIVSQGAAALQEQPGSALAHAIGCAEREVLSAWVPGAGHASGSTLCLALLIDDTLHVTHVGDSRAVLAQGAKAVALTADHKASSTSEAERICAADPSAHITADGYLYGELGVSRGLGSAHLKADPAKRAYVATPEVTSIQLGPSDDFIVLATDGLWDKVGSQDAVAAARRSLAERKDATAASEALVDRAQKLGSQDNISIVVVLLHDRGIVLPKSNSRLFGRRAVAAPMVVGEGVSEGCEVTSAAAAANERGSGGGAACSSA